MSERIEIFELIERLDAASRDETLSDGMLYRAAAERLEALETTIERVRNLQPNEINVEGSECSVIFHEDLMEALEKK